MLRGKNWYVAQKHEDVACYIFLSAQDSCYANVNNQGNYSAGVENVIMGKAPDDIAWHNVTWVLDPKLAKTFWEEESFSITGSPLVESSGEQVTYTSKYAIGSATGLVSQCKKSDITSLVASNSHLPDINPVRAIDGTIGVSELIHHFGVQSFSPVFLLASGTDVMIASFRNRQLSSYAHIVWEQKVVSLKTMVYHNIVPYLQKASILDKPGNLFIINFEDGFGEQIKAVLETNLKIKDINVRNEESYNRLMLINAIEADKRKEAHSPYFQNKALPLIKWKYIYSIVFVGAILILANIVYNFSTNQALLRYWDRQYGLQQQSLQNETADFIAVRNEKSLPYKPQWDKFSKVINYNMPDHAWLQSMLVQFDSGKILFQGYARSKFKSGDDVGDAIFNFGQNVASKLDMSPSSVQVRAVNASNFADLMAKKTSSSKQVVKVFMPGNVNIRAYDAENRIKAHGFQITNFNESQEIILDPVAGGGRRR